MKGVSLQGYNSKYVTMLVKGEIKPGDLVAMGGNNTVDLQVLRTQSEMGMRWCRRAALRCWATREMRLRWVLPRCRQMPTQMRC